MVAAQWWERTVTVEKRAGQQLGVELSSFAGFLTVVNSVRCDSPLVGSVAPFEVVWAMRADGQPKRKVRSSEAAAAMIVQASELELSIVSSWRAVLNLAILTAAVGIAVFACALVWHDLIHWDNGSGRRGDMMTVPPSRAGPSGTVLRVATVSRGREAPRSKLHRLRNTSVRRPSNASVHLPSLALWPASLILAAPPNASACWGCKKLLDARCSDSRSFLFWHRIVDCLLPIYASLSLAAPLQASRFRQEHTPDHTISVGHLLACNPHSR